MNYNTTLSKLLFHEFLFLITIEFLNLTFLHYKLFDKPSTLQNITTLRYNKEKTLPSAFRTILLVFTLIIGFTVTHQLFIMLLLYSPYTKLYTQALNVYPDTVLFFYLAFGFTNI